MEVLRKYLLNAVMALSLALSLALAPVSTAFSATTLRVAAADIPPSLGNPYTATALPATELWSALFDSLTRLDWRGGALPGLAISWENPKPAVWQFKIRPGVTFHSGRPVTAESIVKVFEILKTPAAKRYLVTRELENIQAVRVIGKDIVELSLLQPDAILPKRLAVVMIVDPDAWVDLGVDAFTIAPVGSGPYRLERWGGGNTVARLKAHQGSWRPALSYEDVEYRAVSDKTSRLQALFGGQVDVATGFGVGDIEEIESSGFAAHVTPTTQIKSIALPNVWKDKHPFTDIRVRQALNYAIDKEAIVKFILDGRSEVASQGAVSGITGYNPNLRPYAYDPKKAKALLTEAGYGNGFDMSIEAVSALTPLDPVIFQKVVQDLRVIGINADVRIIPFSDYVRKYTANEWGDVDAFSLLWNNASYQDAIRPFEYFSCLRVNPFFCDKPTAELVLAVQRQTSPQEREIQMQEIMARLHTLAPAIWLTNSVYVNATRAHISGFRMMPTGVVFESMSFAP